MTFRRTSGLKLALAPLLLLCIVAHAEQAPEQTVLRVTNWSAKLLVETMKPVIDCSRPSTEPRLWVFDLTAPALLYAEHASHGRGSGENHAQAFSNIEGSHQGSLGLFAAAETYHGANGYSLRLDGLEPGINDHARERAIVIHSAAYVDPLQALRQGRLGRSFGCPAVRSAVARPLIDSLSDGQLVYACHSDPQWQAASASTRCKSLPGGRQAMSTKQ